MKKLISILLLLAMLAPAAFAQDNYGNWYEIFVRSYQDSDGDGIGDLQGVISRLDYIRDMGYTGIWLMPVMPSPSYHKYDVADYCAIDGEYGTMEDMRQLTAECHARGIRIIIDLPINHSSTQHPWFTEACRALRAGETDNPYVGYYCFSQEKGMKQVPVEGMDWYYEEQFSGGNMPDLNLENEAVLEEIRSIMEFWLLDCGVDGFRLDAVTSYFAADTARNVELLRRINDMAEQIKPGCYLVGEAWTGLTDIAAYYESGIDSFFLFPAAQAEGYIARLFRARQPARDFEKYMNEILEAIPDGILAPFISNHDTGRTIGSIQARSSLPRAKFAEGILNMMGGNAFTYYGEEIGMVGAGDDPNKRLAMFWNDGDMTDQPPGVTKLEYAYPCVDEQLEDENSLLNYCRAVNHLRLQTPSIARGENRMVYTDAYVCVMERMWENETSCIAMNFSASASQEYTLQGEGWTVAGILDASEEVTQVTIGPDDVQMTLAPYGIVVLVRE